MRYISFAQEYEDIILYSAFRDYVENGLYVDIGANDPCMISVTKFFYDRGWRGINIEPLDDMYELLCDERPEDENINVGVSDQNTILEFGNAGTGASFDMMYIPEGVEKSFKRVVRFQELWEKSCFREKEIHFCKIDVEGFEKNVLRGIDFSTFRPWIYIIESVLPNTLVPCYDAWEEILISNGYVFACQHGANRYYVEKNRQYLTDGLVNYRKMFLENDIFQADYKNNYKMNKIQMEKVQKLVIFGAGGYLDNYINYFGGTKIAAIVDNSKQKQGSMRYGIEIQDPNILNDCKKIKNEITVMICCEKSKEIKEQLQEMGITDYIKYYYI